jgi:hypothetical protein
VAGFLNTPRINAEIQRRVLMLFRSSPLKHDEEWSISPGCFEHQLLRRFNSPLFPEIQRRITKAEFKDAKARDARDAADFRLKYTAHVAEGLRLDRQVESLGYVLDYLRRTLELMERISAIGGDWRLESEALKAAAEGCKSLLNSHCSEGVHALERAMNLHFLTISNPFLAQSCRDDGPISIEDEDTWLRALLSEDDATIEQTATWAARMGVRILDRARGILVEAVRDGLSVLESRRKMTLLESGYSKGLETFQAGS